VNGRSGPARRRWDLEGRPWAEMGKSGKALTQNGLARMLGRDRPKIITRNIKVGGQVLKGYVLEEFKEAFERYLPPEGDSEPLPRYYAHEMGTSEPFQTATDDQKVADEKFKKPNNDGPSSGVAVAKGGKRRKRVCTMQRGPRWGRTAPPCRWGGGLAPSRMRTLLPRKVALGRPTLRLTEMSCVLLTAGALFRGGREPGHIVIGKHSPWKWLELRPSIGLVGAVSGPDNISAPMPESRMEWALLGAMMQSVAFLAVQPDMLRHNGISLGNTRPEDRR
jgi:hypothetical protein